MKEKIEIGTILIANSNTDNLIKGEKYTVVRISFTAVRIPFEDYFIVEDKNGKKIVMMISITDYSTLFTRLTDERKAKIESIRL